MRARETGMKFMLLLCVAGLMLGSGCMSTRIKTDLLPESDAKLTAPSGTFYVADLKFGSSTPNPQLAQSYEKYQRQLLPLLRKECMERYPALFSDDPTFAIPLGVDVETTTTMHNLKMLAWMYGTLLISGVILPCPGDSDEDFDVAAFVWSGRDQRQGPSLQKSFRRENHTWVSLLTPAALITIPGESDFPKVSGTIFNVQKMETVYLQQLAPQIATALAKLVVTRDSAYWTAQPRWTGSPSMSPALPSAEPMALPSPTETAAPF